MRLAWILRQRRGLLMQLDPSAAQALSTSASASSFPGIKRPALQPEPSKVRRFGTSLEAAVFSSSRRAAAPPFPSTPPAFPEAPSMSSSQRPSRRARRGAGSARSPAVASHGASSSRRTKGKLVGPVSHLQELEEPMHDQAYIVQEHKKSPIPLKQTLEGAPKSTISNFSVAAIGKFPTYVYVEGMLPNGQRGFRTTVTIAIEPPVVGVGDNVKKKDSEMLAALSALYQLQEMGLLDKPKKLRPSSTEVTDVTLSDGSVVGYERARSFMDYYCRRYKFGQPVISFVNNVRANSWEAIMIVGERRIGLGWGYNKKSAKVVCYLDVTQYLESCDPALWAAYVEASKAGKDLGMAPKVMCLMSDGLNDDIRDLCSDIRKSNLYKNRPAVTRTSTNAGPVDTDGPRVRDPRGPAMRASPAFLTDKSERLQKRREAYLKDEKLERMRVTRESLPVYTRAEDVVKHVVDNDVTICMAATGSGKTTQIPQLILDSYIEEGKGAHCNIVVTQPRRLAAVSVADRVAKERGERLGSSIGYQVRFEAKLPEEHGSITFCTTGIFLKRMQSALGDARDLDRRSLDDVTHVIVDEVHERDIDTDLLLVVLKRMLADRKARNKPLKIVLMSATIDPTLFQKYFPDDLGQPAKVIEIPGRSFPVTKYFLDDFMPHILRGPMNWVSRQEPVQKYLTKELSAAAAAAAGISTVRAQLRDNEEVETPAILTAAAITHALRETKDGHVLVFLSGWDEIMATQRALLNPLGSLGVNFADSSKYAIHLLHSSIPLVEQQVIFELPPEGVRRIILATNIAETSVTIPNVVCVVDTGKVKEQRYDPERHMTSLVSAWVGSSNISQRAGRAGRHRSGEYYGLISKEHVEELQTYQTVEMKRVDLSNVVMHVKALNFPGMTVEEVLAATIEAPESVRVDAATQNLQMVGALDADKQLTSLGRVLLLLPVDAQLGRLVLYGSFFRCLDQALTLAAILSNRDPFVSPVNLKQEAAAKKISWSPDEFRSDALATLRAYNEWWKMQSRGEYGRANQFTSENFLAKPTLLMIQKIKTQLLQSLYQAGVIDVSAGGLLQGSTLSYTPPELNVNGESMPLLAAFIAVACQPNFAIRTSERIFRTAKDKTTFIHPSSVNNRKHVEAVEGETATTERQLYAFMEKRRNATAGASSQTFLVTTTRLDPMTYMLFGAYNIEVTERGLVCDDWLPVIGNLDALDDIQRLKTLIEASMLRVFEGIVMGRRLQRQHRNVPVLPREEETESGYDGDERDYSLSREEVRELDWMTRDVVSILNRYSEEQIALQSRQNSRPATPLGASLATPNRLTTGMWTPTNYQSRPSTPSRLSQRLY